MYNVAVAGTGTVEAEMSVRGRCRKGWETASTIITGFLDTKTQFQSLLFGNRFQVSLILPNVAIAVDL